MSNRNHKREAEGKKPKGRRMPPPEETRLGTRIHEINKYREEDIDTDVERCCECGEWTEADELDENYGFCQDCAKEL